MAWHCGMRRGSYIWGRWIFSDFMCSCLLYSNVRIEKLWVDVTVQVGANWSDNFTNLELHHGLISTILVHGARGHPLDSENLPEEELEVYVVDWEDLRDAAVLQSQRSNNSGETGCTSWLGQAGPLEHLNEVPVQPPQGPFGPLELQTLDGAVSQWCGLASDADIVALWINALTCCRTLNGNRF
ncbi:hypothetical protein B0H11DRAFT_2160460 [Mycena galericulata]|nr:hypothetical protein B0H11DRAFT_2160460 [Mycena galericulata]